MRTFRRGLVAAVVGLAIGAPAAGAQVVANPGPVTFIWGAGSGITVGVNSWSLAGSTYTGDVAADGTVSNIAVSVPDAEVNGSTVHTALNGTATGSIDPATGAASFAMPLVITISSTFSGTTTVCTTTTSVSVSTASTGGVPYNAGTGTLTVTQQGFSVAQSTPADNFICDFINDNTPLPTTNTAIALVGSVSPILTAPPPPAPTCNGQNATIHGQSGTINGTSGSDVIVGSGGADTIDGGDGDDIICADDGDDRVVGGAGNDTIAGQDGADRVFGGSGLGDSAGGNDDLNGGGGNDRLFGEGGNDRSDGESGNDVISDAKGDDTLIGGSLNDQLSGGAGNDNLSGDAGQDVLNGGAGIDICDGGSHPGDTAPGSPSTCETRIGIP